MVVRRTPALEAAIVRASDDHGLASYYRDCVRPLLGMPMKQWPRCCGRGCEPCQETLTSIARQVYTLLEVDGANGLPHEDE
ncbi:MAG TPA: hypothetical protein VHM19_11585 [Polyangiales bacterium]|jgi:hypothetical protein|nr:hypothetical protein [Polyangiales bacterium]